MRDFYPEDIVIRDTLFNTWRAASRQFGFAEYDSCVVETLDLLKRKSGEDITRQIYAFRDKSGRELALRPEMTPTLARMIATRHGSLSFPLKWFCVAQCFRYERMTRGRKREHYQWNLDIVGETSVAAEAEVIAAALHALASLGLGNEDVRVLFSSRALLGDLLLKLGIGPEHHPATFLVLDKRTKIGDDGAKEMLAKAGLVESSIKRVFDLFSISSFEEVTEILDEQTPSLRDIVRFQEILIPYGISDAVTFDLSVMRGLAYYTGIVFEAFDAAGKFRAIFGGGRYDNLLGEIGGKPLSGVGLGFGDVVVSEILADSGKAKFRTSGVQTAISYMQEEQRNTAISIATGLRSRGKTVNLSQAAEKAKKFFSRAGKAGVKKAIYVGPDDVAGGAVRIKDLKTHTEQEVRIEELVG